MHLNTLTAISPLDGRYLSKVENLQALLSEYGLLHYRLLVEIRWLQELAHAKLPGMPSLSPDASLRLDAIVDHFSIADAEQIKAIEKTTHHDVKAVEYFLQTVLKQDPDLLPFIPFLHFACTSEDINNVSYALLLKTARDTVLIPALAQITDHLRGLTQQYAALPMLAHTHGQAATPTTVGKELGNILYRLSLQIQALQQLSFPAKFNGAVGNFNAHYAAYPEVDWPTMANQFITHLGLTYNPYTIQIEPHDGIVTFAQTLEHINHILVDACRDCWGYIALDYFQQQRTETEVGSSTMPHKVNPIDFENSEGNLGMANALLAYFARQLPTSRWQRDLVDSTVLRNLGVALGHSLLAYRSFFAGLKKISPNTRVLEKELNAHWELLAEPIQTVMRRYGITDAYEQLKALSRGQTLTHAQIQEFITGLAIPASAKQALLALTPSHYVGIAERLALEIASVR